MKINFILPYPARKPGGGHKIVFQYADFLAEKGHEIHLIFPIELEYLSYNRHFYIRWLMHFILRTKWHRWFVFKNKIHFHLVKKIEENTIPTADITVASYWATAFPISQLSKQKGKKFYFIQSFETWDGNESKVIEGYYLSLSKIVISKWLKKKIESLSKQTTVYIPNAIHQKDFYIQNKGTDRDVYTAIMLYSSLEIKGGTDGVLILNKVKEKIPNFQAIVFGVGKKPRFFPDWIKYFKQPNLALLRTLYNKASVYLCPSQLEGWALPPAEAALCGCAIVGYDIGGLKDYAIHSQTALLAPCYNKEILAGYLLELIRNRSKRDILANNAKKYLDKHFKWEDSVNKIEMLFN